MRKNDVLLNLFFAILFFIPSFSTPVLAFTDSACPRMDGEDGMWAEGCAKVTTSAGECVSEAIVFGSGSAAFASKTSNLHYYLTTSRGYGIWNNGNFSGSYGPASKRVTSQTTVSQKTTTSLEWGSNSGAYNGNRVLTPGYTATWNTSGTTFDTSAPERCFGAVTSGAIVGANGGYYACSGSVNISWTGKDSGCAGFHDFSSTYTASSGSATAMGCDNFMQCSETCKLSWTVDCKGPCQDMSLKQDITGWTQGPVEVSAVCSSDDGVGLSGCTTYSATKEDEVASVTCSDKLNNKTTKTKTVTNIDTSHPYCIDGGLSSTPAAGIYVKTEVPAWAKCGDARSGCTTSDGMYYGMISGGSGTVSFSDNVGLGGSCTINYGFNDSSKPDTTITFDSNHTNNSESEYTADPEIEVTVSAKDNGSAGVNRVCYQLTGEQKTDELCTDGSSVKFTISAEGQTHIRAWSFDNAYDYSSSKGYYYNGGNRSSDVKKTAYIDRTKPNLTSYTADDDGTVSLSEVKMALTSAYDDIKDEHPWINTPVLVTVDSFDTKYRDGSSSGLGSIEYYWGLTANPAEVWGAAHTNRKYNTSNNPTETIPTKALAGSDYKANNVPYDDRHDYTPSVSNPANNSVLNDELYLHVRVCDRATTYKGQKAPNCTTAVYGPVYYDDMPPNIVKPVVPPSDKTPTNPSTDPDNPTPNPKDPVGGTGSEIVEPTDIPTDATAMDRHDWTNKLVIAFSAYEHMQDSEVHTGKKANSGVDKIEFYYDRNYNHETATLNKNTHTVLDNYRQNCAGEKVCSYYLDFNSLSNYPDNNSYTVMEEGNRFIKVRVYDVAGNVQDFYFGPYRFDITPNTISNIEFSGQTGTMIDK